MRDPAGLAGPGAFTSPITNGIEPDYILNPTSYILPNMLRSLTIRDYVILDDLNLSFEDGFTAITGETGAGKSLLVDVLGLLLGDRAEGDLATPGARQAELSALFELSEEHPALAWLAEQSLDDENSCLLRRVLPAAGSSRGWINGRPATMGQLKTVGALLVDIHGQHEHQRLTDTGAQTAWLDAQLEPGSTDTVKHAAAQWREAREALSELEREAGDQRDREFLAFQYKELEALALAEGEFAELDAEQQRLSRTDDLLRASSTAMEALDGPLDDSGPPGLRGQLNTCITTLESVAEIDPGLAEIAGMLRESSINIDEAAAVLERRSSEIEADPARLAEVDRRLGEALTLARKHRVEPEQLPALTLETGERLARLEDLDAERARRQEAIESARGKWLDAAKTLSKQRGDTAKKLSATIDAHLAELGMGDARVSIRVDANEDAPVSDAGMDRVEILFSANPGQSPQPLRKIASGGELSRFSLAMVAAVTRPESGRVRVFDEVDAGVGGETAHAVGRFLSEVSRGGQAFCVTHLAQVAARADHQYRVTKSASGGKTSTRVDILDTDTRRKEVARMLGSSDSDRGLAHAEELLALQD